MSENHKPFFYKIWLEVEKFELSVIENYILILINFNENIEINTISILDKRNAVLKIHLLKLKERIKLTRNTVVRRLYCFFVLLI